MRDELKKIALELRKWAEKYNKDYITMAYVYGDLMANIENTDDDYDECSLFITNGKER